MKAKNLFFGALACLAFAACSNDDEPTVNGGGAQGENSYMAVNLTMASDITRATTDQGHVDGTENESAVKISATKFYFYDSYGNFLTEGTLATTLKDGNEDGNAKPEPGDNDFLLLKDYTDDDSDPSSDLVDRQSDAVIILGPTERQPAYVLAVLNTDINLSGLTMANAYNAVYDEAISTNKGDFVMTNSTYMTGAVGSSRVVYAQAINAASICGTIAAALTNPVDIYVERIVAKIKMANSTSNPDLVFEVADEFVNNTQVKMRVEVKGWKINAVNEKSYAIKHLSSISALYNSALNNAAGFRSYWAEDANYSGATADYTGDSYTGLKYYTFNDVTTRTADDSYEYCYENTVRQSDAKALPGNRTNTTTMLIAAQATYSEDGSTWETAKNLYRFNGQLYTEESYINLYMQALQKEGYRWKYTNSLSETVYEDLKASELTASFVAVSTDSKNDFKQVKWEATALTPSVSGAVLVDGANAEISSGDYVTTINAVFNATDMASKTEGYLNGYCYYQVPIEHLFSISDSEKYGVVRNHVYELTLSNITKLGDAVYFPEQELEYIPGERKNYYVAARLNVLTWRVVSQNVEL